MPRNMQPIQIKEPIFYLAIPVLEPYFADDIDGDLQNIFLKEIESLSGLYFANGVKIEYKSVHDVENYGNLTQMLSPKRILNNKIFVFQMTISNFSYLLKPYEKMSAEQYFFFSVFSYLSIFGYSLAYALGVYSGGIFDVGDFVTYYDDHNYGTNKGVLSSFSYLHKKDNVFYPSSNGITLQKTLDWFLSVEDVVNACGKTALGKSLSIYSRMFSSTSGDEELFMSGLHSVMALEALYESHGSKNALSEKVAAFLEIDAKKCKKDIDDIYNHRCSVAHGGFELPFKFNANDGSKDFEKSYDKVNGAFELGLLYLFKSYRKMVLENKKELFFAYKCL